jgi:hypothetical protein
VSWPGYKEARVGWIVEEVPGALKSYEHGCRW